MLSKYVVILEFLVWLARVVLRIFIARVPTVTALVLTECQYKVCMMTIENSDFQLTWMLTLTIMTHAFVIRILL